MKLKNIVKFAVTFTMAATMAFSFAACEKPDEPGPGPGPGIEIPVQPKISMSDLPETLEYNGVTNFTVTVENAEDKTYKLSYDETLVKIQQTSSTNVLTVIKDVRVDTKVTVTATANASADATVTKTIIIKAKTIDGQVGELTSELISEIGNERIKVTGTLTDYYNDLIMPSNSVKNEYEMSVTMSPDEWSGSWKIKGNDYNTTANVYKKGADGTIDAGGNAGHALLEVHIDKDNKVAETPVIDYNSNKALWESMHYWNHLGNLDVTSFTYNMDSKVYTHTVDVTDIEDLYLMTYLSYSLTPLLEDTLNEINLVIEDGHITKLIAQTEVLYQIGGEITSRDKAEEMSYSTIELTFSEIGTAAVESPTPYAAPDHADLLKSALDEMHAATNYTYKAVDTTTRAPSSESGDYELSASVGSGFNVSLLADDDGFKYANAITASGTVGSIGYITTGGYLYSETTKYSYTMDNKPYRTVWKGCKQEDGYYEQFEYNKDINDGKGGFNGAKKVVGNYLDTMPKFEFSPNVFAWSGSSKDKGGKDLYTFTLRDSAISRDIALQVSAYGYAKNAAGSSTLSFKITVNEDGKLVSTDYPYSINYGTYTGHVITTYGEVGTTAIDAAAFEGYVARKVPENWSDFNINYRPGHQTNIPDNYVSGDTVIAGLFGDYASYVPAPSLFIEIFGDNLTTAWHDWKNKATDADGNKIYTDYISMNTTSLNYDINSKITDWEEITAKINTVLTQAGYSYLQGNSDPNGTRSASKNRYLCYTKTNSGADGGVQIVFENNGTRWISMYIYKLGDWTLSTRA